MKVLLHICCAPCSAACIKVLREKDYDITGYWYNPNIHPYKEYEARLNALKEYSKLVNLDVIYNDYYGLREFTKNVVNDIPNRCKYCYYSRMENVVKYAKENGYDAFTSTLFISPYQKHDMLKNICEELSKKYDIKFLYIDFRPFFYEGKKMFHDTGLYMQKYCGCIFSEEDRYLNTSNNKLSDSSKDNIEIKEVKDDKEQYMDLLLEADPEVDVVKKYLSNSDLFVLTYNDEVSCVAAVIKLDDKTCELKNIATLEKYRGHGLGKKMIDYLFNNYKNKYDKMIVGTTENNIPFYVKRGFDKYEKTLKNFFVDNYEEEIWDGDLHCFDMYCYSKDLRK